VERRAWVRRQWKRSLRFAELNPVEFPLRFLLGDPSAAADFDEDYDTDSDDDDDEIRATGAFRIS